MFAEYPVGSVSKVTWPLSEAMKNSEKALRAGRA